MMLFSISFSGVARAENDENVSAINSIQTKPSLKVVPKKINCDNIFTKGHPVISDKYWGKPHLDNCVQSNTLKFKKKKFDDTDYLYSQKVKLTPRQDDNISWHGFKSKLSNTLKFKKKKFDDTDHLYSQKVKQIPIQDDNLTWHGFKSKPYYMRDGIQTGLLRRYEPLEINTKDDRRVYIGEFKG